MTLFYSPSAGGFFASEIHPALPEDAVEISTELHSELLTKQEAGAAIVAGPDGEPIASFPPPPTLDQLRGYAVEAVKVEAKRRILAAYPMWRQINDIVEPSVDGAARRKVLDGIRERSNAIEAMIATASAPDLSKLDIAADDLWL